MTAAKVFLFSPKGVVSVVVASVVLVMTIVMVYMLVQHSNNNHTEQVLNGDNVVTSVEQVQEEEEWDFPWFVWLTIGVAAFAVIVLVVLFGLKRVGIWPAAKPIDGGGGGGGKPDTDTPPTPTPLTPDGLAVLIGGRTDNQPESFAVWADVIKNNCKKEGVFRLSANKNVLDAYIAESANNPSLPPANVELAVGAMKRFLDRLSQKLLDRQKILDLAAKIDESTQTDGAKVLTLKPGQEFDISSIVSHDAYKGMWATILELFKMISDAKADSKMGVDNLVLTSTAMYETPFVPDQTAGGPEKTQLDIMKEGQQHLKVAQDALEKVISFHFQTITYPST